MLLNNGDEWTPEESDIIKWNTLYPAVNVEQELRKMEGWLDANPRKRKTKMGVKRFVNSWLSRAQDQGGSPDLTSKPENPCVIKTRDMTSLDELTHNFTGDPAIKAHYIATHGQCFEDGVRYTA